MAKVTPRGAERYASFQGIELHIVGDLDAWLDRAPTKLVVIGDPDALDRLGGRLRPQFADRLWVTKSLPFFLELAAEGVSKASGLSFLAERMGFEQERTLAFGDGARTISSWSTGAATASRSRTPTLASRRSPTGSARPPPRRAWLR